MKRKTSHITKGGHDGNARDGKGGGRKTRRLWQEGFFKECSVPAPSMTLPPPTEPPYSEIQKMMALAPSYGFEFVAPKG